MVKCTAFDRISIPNKPLAYIFQQKGDIHHILFQNSLKVFQCSSSMWEPIKSIVAPNTKVICCWQQSLIFCYPP